MQTTKQSAAGDWNPFATPTGSSTYNDPALAEKNYREFAKHLGGATAAGIGIGIGAGGLYQLAKYLRGRARQATAKPPLESLVNAPLLPNTAEQDKVAFDSNMVLLPALGAGAGALIGATRQKAKGQRLRAALSGAAVGGAGGLAGAALTSAPVMNAVSKGLGGAKWMYFNPLFASTYLLGGGGTGVPAKDPPHQAAMGLAGALLPAAGVYGGLKMVNTLAKSDNSQANRDAITNARDEYFSALTGNDTKKKKPETDEKTAAALDVALDELFAQTKKARQEKRAIPKWLANLGNNIKDYGYAGFRNTSAMGLGLMGIGALGAGAIGARHMYKATKAESEARALARARAARERMRGLDAPWIDPIELAEIKRMAAGGAGM
jgi:hypothetical protein